MTLPPGWHRVRRPTLGRSGVERDVERELRAHLDMKIEELLTEGLTRSEAEQAARAAFGDLERVEAECVDVRQQRAIAQRRSDMLHGLAYDVRFGIRALGDVRGSGAGTGGGRGPRRWPPCSQSDARRSRAGIASLKRGVPTVAATSSIGPS